MQQNIRQVIWFLLFIGFLSMAYFLSLPLHIPFWVVITLVLAAGIWGYRWLNTNVKDTPGALLTARHITWSYVVLLAGIVIITNKAYYMEQEYGLWDAWCIWDYHARFLMKPEFLKCLYTVSFFYHADYPLYLSSMIAFFWRIVGTETMVVPFIFAFFVSLMIPVIIYFSLYRKSLPVAALVLFLFAFDEFYLEHALAQYADLPLGFLLLCAFICLDHLREQVALVAVIAALLGCCIWMKNEGILLALVFTVFNIRTFFAGGRWKYFLAGIAFPIITLAFFKSSTQVNDIVNAQGGQSLVYLSDLSRYGIICNEFLKDINAYFFQVKIGLLIYVVLCIAGRQWPDRKIGILLCCVFFYFFTYVLSPMRLDWHLQSSLDRVLLQLMPSFVYVIALRLSEVQFVLPNKQLQ